jgi:pimeloyl-ACP methyl ester carboxylesterase
MPIFSVISRLLVMLSLILTLPSQAAPAAGNRQADSCVVLVHGLARTSYSMRNMEQALQAAGYQTVNVDYPSRSHPIQDLAAMVGEAAVKGCGVHGSNRIHFITHSLGGILVRYYLARNSIEGLGRVVMLAPPNQGSLLTDQLRSEAWYQWLTGPAGQQLGTGSEGIPGKLGPVDFPLGVIAGNVHSPIDNWLAQMIPGEDDGKVSVDRARVDGMRDFLVLPYTHISIMQEDEVITQSLHFLAHGHFDHVAAEQLLDAQRNVREVRPPYLD